MVNDPNGDVLEQDASAHFQQMVESVGVKVFADAIDLSTRQINRMLVGAQPNPVERIIRALQSCTPESGDAAIEYVCAETGGRFVKAGSFDDQDVVLALRQCADAIEAAQQHSEQPMLPAQEAHRAMAGLAAGLFEAEQIAETLTSVIEVKIAPSSREGVEGRGQQ